MHTHPLFLVAAAATLTGLATPQPFQDVPPSRSFVAERLHKRQSTDDDFDFDERSICYSYGIDFQHDKSYFIDSRSSERFTVVSQFDQCEPDTSAYIILVNNETEDQWECTGVPTTPNLQNQMSICPITKSEMTSGSWSVIVIGNNGDGSPFAWQRDFTLTVGIPVTSTTTSTVTYTETTTPRTTITIPSTIHTTTSVPNKSTITVAAATRTITVTPKAMTTTSTKWLTRTVHRWTKSQSVVTKTAVPTCTIPPRPSQHDPECRIVPTVIPLPKGLTIQASLEKRADRAASLDSLRRQIEDTKFLKARRHLAAQQGIIQPGKRSPNAPTVYIQAPMVVNATTTITAPVSTESDISLTTSTHTITNPPRTVQSGTQTITTTLPPKTKTITRIHHTTVTRTRTMHVTWTYTTTVKPSASASACKKLGGHLVLYG